LLARVVALADASTSFNETALDPLDGSTVAGADAPAP
jgi:hypothetical protein